MKKIVYVERRFGHNRPRVVPYERNRALIEASLQGALIDAEKELAQAFGLNAGHMGYAVRDLFFVSGGGDDELSNYELDLLENLRAFKKELPGWQYGLAIDMAAFCHDLEEIVATRKLKKSAVLENYKTALNLWCVMRGWGDQIS